MNSEEMFQNFEIKDNDEEDDKMEEGEINAQLNIIPESDGRINNNLSNEEEKMEELNEKLDKNYNDNFIDNINININEKVNKELDINNNVLLDSETKSIFRNPYLQTSYNLFTKLRRIIIRKENLTKINYFDRWQKIVNYKEKENNLNDRNNIEINALIQNRNVIQNILNKEEYDNSSQKPNNIKNSENKTQNEIIFEHQNQLLKSGNQNFQSLINPFASINEMNFETDYSYQNNNNNNNNEKILNSNLQKEKKILCLSIINIFKNKIYYYFKQITQGLKFRIILSNYHDKLFQMDRLNKKYETILDEKSSIIINKTDEIEDLKEKLENISKNLKEALKKQKALNIIPESLCSKCGRSLEESFCGENNNENQKIIKEQNELIEKMKKEMNELRNKYNYSELRLKDYFHSSFF